MYDNKKEGTKKLTSQRLKNIGDKNIWTGNR